MSLAPFLHYNEEISTYHHCISDSETVPWLCDYSNGQHDYYWLLRSRAERCVQCLYQPNLPIYLYFASNGAIIQFVFLMLFNCVFVPLFVWKRRCTYTLGHDLILSPVQSPQVWAEVRASNQKTSALSLVLCAMWSIRQYAYLGMWNTVNVQWMHSCITATLPKLLSGDGAVAVL